MRMGGGEQFSSGKVMWVHGRRKKEFSGREGGVQRGGVQRGGDEAGVVGREKSR